MIRRAVSGVVVFSTLALLVGCLTTPAPEPVFAELTWMDLERNIRSTLVSRGFEDYDTLQRSGRLHPSVKIIEPDEMGSMIGVLDEYDFFERATGVSPDAPELRGKTPQFISLRRAQGVLTQIFIPRPGQDSEKVDWDRDFVQIKKAILTVHRNTVQFSLVPPGGRG